MLGSGLSTAHKVSVIIKVPFTHFPLSSHLHSPSCITPPLYGKGKGKGKVHPKTGHEGPEGEQKYGSTLSLTLALDGMGGQRHAPVVSPPGKTWYPLYRRPGLDVCRKSRPHWDSIRGPSSP